MRDNFRRLVLIHILSFILISENPFRDDLFYHSRNNSFVFPIFVVLLHSVRSDTNKADSTVLVCSSFLIYVSTIIIKSRIKAAAHILIDHLYAGSGKVRSGSSQLALRFRRQFTRGSQKLPISRN